MKPSRPPRITSTPRRSPSRSNQRAAQQRRRALAIGASTLLILAAFFAGLTWKKWKTKPTEVRSQAATQVATAQQQADALRLMDEAVKAKYEERYDDALRIVEESRHADPGIRGVDYISGEIALQRGESQIVKSFSREAIRRGENVADATLLLALDTWMSRGQPERAAQAGAVATQILEEASMKDLSSGEVRFFLGDLQRLLGQPASAHRSLLAGAARLSPWSSSELILAKLQLAADEAGATADSIEIPSTAGNRAVLRLGTALRHGQDPQAALDIVVACFTTRQTTALLADAYFASLSDSSRKTVFDNLSKSLPGPEPPVSEVREKTSS